MKRIHIFFTLLFTFLLLFPSSAQVPESFAFQAVLRGPTGNLITDQKVDITVTLVGGEIYPAFGYTESHEDAVVNENGLITLQIGEGTPVHGSFQNIPWSDGGPVRIMCTVTPHGSAGSITSHSTLHSVPFAMHAKTAEALSTPFIEVDGSVENEIQELSVSPEGDTLYLSKSNWVIIPGISAQNSASKMLSDQFSSPAILNNPMGNSPEKRVQVYLPPGYYRNKRFPVVYLLPGTPFIETAYTDIAPWYALGLETFATPPDFPAAGFKGWMDSLISNGTIAEMIVVMPDASAGYGWSWYTDSELNGGYEAYITQDLVNYIDQNYKTIASPSARAVMGHCMGGYGAIKFGLKRPDVFGVAAANQPMLSIESLRPIIPLIIAENPTGMTGPDPSKFFTSMIYAMSAAFSPNLGNAPFYVDLPFDWPDSAIVEDVWSRWLMHDILSMDVSNAVKLNGLYFDWGVNDEFGIFNADPWALADALDQQLVDYEFQTHDGGHWSNLYGSMQNALAFISERWAYEPQ